MTRFKHWMHEVLEVSKKRGSLSWYVDLFIMSLIFLNILAFMLETVESIYSRSPLFFIYFEYFSVLVFTVEYLLRIWTANLNKGYERPFIGRFHYALTPLALIDLFAVLPFYLPLLGIDLRFLRMLRLFRLFRLFKIMRYITAVKILHKTIRTKKEELMVSLILLIFLLLFTSSMMYFIEHDVQPEAFSSIPETMWWGISTITTVGYGDVYPITSMGKALAGVVVVLGVGMIALPTGILVTGFMNQIGDDKSKSDETHHCPHCGKRID